MSPSLPREDCRSLERTVLGLTFGDGSLVPVLIVAIDAIRVSVFGIVPVVPQADQRLHGGFPHGHGFSPRLRLSSRVDRLEFALS